MKFKDNIGFTLIELLVVVAIIGILAAIGITQFGGFTESAKKNAVKSIHKSTVKFIQAEIAKCSLGQQVLLKKIEGNSVVNQTDLCPKIKNILIDNNSYDVLEAFDLHFKTENWKNPYNSEWAATSVCTVRNNSVYYLNPGGTCIWRETGKEIIVGSNLDSARSEVLISTILTNF
jgi:prepilin-type N-terminal cleavage/methylation domain-containing protein